MLALVILKGLLVTALILAVAVVLCGGLAACMLSSRISRDEEAADPVHFGWPR